MKTFLTMCLVLLALTASMALAQNRTITGKVSSKKGNPIAGVTVLVKGTALGGYTKTDGTYKLVNVPADAKTLIFKMIGMKKKEMNIGTEETIDIAMEEDVLSTDEVVVTAIGLEREKKGLGYSLQTVGGSELSQSREINIVNAISSKVAGVQVTSSAGVPGASSFIRIRGSASLEGENQPLFVIDGVPIDNSQVYSGNPDDLQNNLTWGVAYSNRAIDINPDDVASMTVLKGPAATALYGIRAAGGAIIITTKRGSATYGDKVNVSYSGSLSTDEVNKLPELQSKYSQGTGGKYSGPETGQRLSWGAPIENLRYDPNTPNKFNKNGTIVDKNAPGATNPVIPFDNMNNFFQTGKTWTNSLSIAGGSDASTYYFSLSNMSSEGIIPNSEFERTTVKITGDTKITRDFKISGTASYIASGGTRIQQGSNTSGVMLGLGRTPPTFDNTAGYIFSDSTQRSYRGGGGYDNPFWTANKNLFTDDVNRLIGNVQFDYLFTDWFSAMYRLGGDFWSDRRKQHFAIGSATASSGQVFNHQIYNRDINSDLILTFNKKLTPDLDATLLLGHNMFESSTQSVYVQGDGLIIPDFYHISNTAGQLIRESVGKLRRAAIYADIRLNYTDIYFLNATLRNEWSTTLPEANNSFMYYSLSGAVVFTEALNIADNDIMQFGKLRVNYAVVGKDAPIYYTTTTYSQGTYNDGWTDGISFPFGGNVGYMQGDVIGSADLKPEKTSSFEIGADLRFFNNLFGVDVTYYDQTSEDQIFQVPIAGSTGYLSLVSNNGKITNNGIEVVLTATPINSNGFRWDAMLNWSKNTNKVEALAPGVENIDIGGFQGATIRAVVGSPYGTIFGHGWLRDKNGNIIIESDSANAAAEGRLVGYPIIDPKEKTFGTATPDWQMGFRNTFSYEGITISALLDIRKGGLMWNGTRGALVFFGTHKDTEIRGTTKVFTGVKGTLIGDSVVTTGVSNDANVVLDQKWLNEKDGHGFGQNTEDFIEDTGWVRLRELSLSYQLPTSIIDDLPFSGIRVTYTGRNLWLSTDYTGVDPETSNMGAHNAQGLDYFNMPNTRSHTFSLNVDF